jgi:phosphate transport system substrate-binding protein
MMDCVLKRPRAIFLTLVVGLLSSGCVVKTTPVPSGGSSSNQTVNHAATDSPVALPAAANSNQAASTISAEGSSTVYPICQAFAVEFEKKTNHKVSVGRQGTGGGYKKFVNRQADIWNASRLITDTEKEELKAKRIEWIQLDIAVDGIVIAVNPKNTWCSNLTCVQLKQMWEPDAKAKNWSDIDGSWPAEPILLFGADSDSGTFEYFTEEINGVKKATNTNYTPASDDNVLVQGIATNKGALGYIPFGYYVENTDKLKAVAISQTKKSDDTLAPFVEPTVDSILNDEYKPLSRPLYMYVNKDSLKRPEVAEFLKYATSEGSQHLVEKRGFVPLKESARLASVLALETAMNQPTAAK